MSVNFLMYIKNIHIFLFATIIIVSASCKKRSVETNYNPSLAVANNQVIAERAYSQVFNIFFMVVNDSVLKADGSNSIYGAQCSYQETPEIKFIIDFLHYYTPCPDGKVRKGVITATLNKDFIETGAIAELSFSDYTVDELRLEGNNIISNNGLSASMLQMYEHNIPSATLTFIDSIVEHPYHWESVKTFIYLAGMGTPSDFSDDMFEIVGESSGTDVNGVAFSAYTDEALGNYFNCRWIRTGITILNTPGLEVKSGYIDYIGEESCTNQVMYFFDGNPFYDEFIFH